MGAKTVKEVVTNYKEANNNIINLALKVKTFMFSTLDGDYYYFELNGDFYYKAKGSIRLFFGEDFISCFDCIPIIKDKEVLAYAASDYVYKCLNQLKILYDKDLSLPYVICHRGMRIYKCYILDDKRREKTTELIDFLRNKNVESTTTKS